MNGAILPLPEYALMVWCSLKAQGQLYLLPLPPNTSSLLHPNILLRTLFSTSVNCLHTT